MDREASHVLQDSESHNTPTGVTGDPSCKENMDKEQDKLRTKRYLLPNTSGKLSRKWQSIAIIV